MVAVAKPNVRFWNQSAAAGRSGMQVHRCILRLSQLSLIILHYYLIGECVRSQLVHVSCWIVNLMSFNGGRRVLFRSILCVLSFQVSKQHQLMLDWELTIFFYVCNVHFYGKFAKDVEQIF